MSPAQSVIARLSYNLGETPVLRKTPTGEAGTRFYHITTSDLAAAETAAGLPSKGQQWDATKPDLQVVDITFTHYAGKDVDADNHGYHLARVEYRTPEAQPPELLVNLNDSFSEIVEGQAQVPIGFDINGDPIPQTNRSVDADELLIRAYRATPTYNVWKTIRNKVNSDFVLAPNVQRVPGSWIVFNPGQLLAQPMSVRPFRADLLELTYRFRIADLDHLYRFRVEDEQGNPTGPVEEKPIYESTPVGAIQDQLW